MKPTPPVSTDNRAASPVLGVLLMVGLTVILAAVTGGYLLQTSEETTGGTVQAGATAEFNSNAEEIVATFTSAPDSGTELEVDFTVVEDGSGDADTDRSETLSSPGSSTTITDYESGDRIKVVVTAVNGETSAVITERTETL